MISKLSPPDLRSVIDRDCRFKRAEAILTNRWYEIIDNYQTNNPMMTYEDIMFACRLNLTHTVKSNINLTTFSGVQTFIKLNQSYISRTVIYKLKEPFL